MHCNTDPCTHHVHHTLSNKCNVDELLRGNFHHAGGPAAHDERPAHGASPDAKCKYSSRGTDEAAIMMENAANQGTKTADVVQMMPNESEAQMRMNSEKVPAAQAKRAAQGDSADYSRMYNKLPRKSSYATDAHDMAVTEMEARDPAAHINQAAQGSRLEATPICVTGLKRSSWTMPLS